MSETATEYPQPSRDTDNAEFIDGWRAGRLLLQHCRSCGRNFFYARPMCPDCWSIELEWIEAEGRGEIVSYSVVHRPSHPAFFAEAPLLLAEVRLREGATMLARIICEDYRAVQSGLAIALVSDAEAGRFALPVFRPDVKQAAAVR